MPSQYTETFQPVFCPEVMKSGISHLITNLLENEKVKLYAACEVNHRDHLRLVIRPMVEDCIRSIAYSDYYLFSKNAEFKNYALDSLNEKDESIATEWILDQLRPHSVDYHI